MKSKIIMLVGFMILSSGCVSYNHTTWPNGKQIQMGSYMENSDINKSHLWFTDSGKRITKLNKEWDTEWMKRYMSNTNSVTQ